MATSVQIPETRVTPAPVAGADIADPGQLGLAAFAATTFILCMFNSGIMSGAYEHVVLPMALVYGGAVQILAGMWEYKKNNTFGATAFASYGAFWISFAVYIWWVAPGLVAAAKIAGDTKFNLSNATGVWLLAWTIFTVIMLCASFGVSKALVTVFSLLTITFILLTWGVWGGHPNLAKTSGYFGLATAAAAWYASAAGVTKSTFGRQILPVGSMAK